MNRHAFHPRQLCDPWFIVAIVLTLATLPCLARAQAPGPEIIRLKVHPAHEPRPALRWHLLPSTADRKPGNAATMYLMGLAWTDSGPSHQYENLSDIQQAIQHPEQAETTLFLNVPLDKLPVEHLKSRFLSSGAYQVYETGAFRDHCAWDLPREQGAEMLLPHLNITRHHANLLAMQARVQMAEGDVPGAMHTLEIIMSWAKDFDTEAVIVQSLVGAGLEAISLKQVESLIELPDCPNLYWALAELPRPYFNLPRMVRRDHEQLAFSFPLLHRDLDRDPLSPEQWRSIMAELNRLAPPSDQDKWAGLLTQPAVYAATTYPEAKAYLIARGMPRQQVEAMNSQTVVAKWMIESFNEVCDNTEKWFSLPLGQQYDGMQRASDALDQTRHQTQNLLIATFASSLNRLAFVFGRLDRRVAILQTVEALRAYAATHDGKLPAALADLTDTPAPIDPMTGQPFEYRVEGNTALLTAPPLPPSMPPREGPRYEITIEK